MLRLRGETRFALLAAALSMTPPSATRVVADAIYCPFNDTGNSGGLPAFQHSWWEIALAALS
jgi:hypothetical protein